MLLYEFWHWNEEQTEHFDDSFLISPFIHTFNGLIGLLFSCDFIVYGM
jgi:hypothetical protein